MSVINDEKYYIEKYLKQFQNKKEKLHEKSGFEERTWKFEEMLNEQRVLGEIIDFLWKKL